MASKKLLVRVCGALFGINILNSSEITHELSSSIFSPASFSISNPIEIIQKFPSPSLECTSIALAGDIASSIQAEAPLNLHLKGLGVAFVVISSGFGIHRYLTHRQRPQSEHRKSTSGGSRPTKYRGFLNRSANHCFANALLACLVYLPGFKEKIFHAAAAPKNSSNLVLKSLAALFTTINQDRRRLDAVAVEVQKGKFCNEITKSSPEVKLSLYTFCVNFFCRSRYFMKMVEIVDLYSKFSAKIFLQIFNVSL